MDVVTAALEGRLRSPGTGGVDKHREQAERLVHMSEAAPPEKEVERRVVQMYSKLDRKGELHYEGKWISHAYRPEATGRMARREGQAAVGDGAQHS